MRHVQKHDPAVGPVGAGWGEPAILQRIVAARDRLGNHGQRQRGRPQRGRQPRHRAGQGTVNRDGKPEIIVGYVKSPGEIFFNDGTGRKYTRVKFGDSKGATYGLAVGDFNGDGYPDIVAARSEAPSLVFFSRP